MFKNTASQKLTVYVFDSTTNLPKTGDAANLTAYESLDNGAVTVLGDTSATEQDATNAKGFYLFDLTQGETNADKIMFSCKSSTANMVCLCMPAVVYTVPTAFGLVAGAAGGLFISGTNSSLTITGATILTGNVSLADGLTIAAPSTANRSGITVTGNGTGHGVSVTGGNGATGDGIKAVAASTNGNGLNVLGTGTGDGLLGTGGAGAGGDGVAGVAGGGVAIRGPLDVVTLVNTLTTYTGNTPQTGDSFALANGASGFAAIKTVVDAIKVVTDKFVFTIANKVDAAIVNAASFAQAAADLVWGTAARTLTAFGFSVTLASSQLFIKKNTAYTTFKFVMTDSTTHAPATGLTVTSTRAIDNGAFGACANAASELSDGWYKIDLDATDLNGVDIALRFTAPTADDKNFKIVTQT